MEPRKIQLVGHRSYAISLPKKWVIDNNMKEKDVVFVEVTENNNILVKKNDSVNKLDNMIFNADEINNIKEFLVFCYVKNIEKVVLKSKKFTIERISMIKKILTYLDGYDVVNEDENVIEISFLFKETNISLKKLLGRISYLISILFESIKKDDGSMIEEVENNIDRLYHLSRRILLSCVNNQEIRLQNQIYHIEDTFFYLDIIKKLERFADYMHFFYKSGISDDEIKKLEYYVKLLGEIVMGNANFMKNKNKLKEILDIDLEKSENKHYFYRVYNLFRDIIDNYMSIDFNNKYFK